MTVIVSGGRGCSMRMAKNVPWSWFWTQLVTSSERNVLLAGAIYGGKLCRCDLENMLATLLYCRANYPTRKVRSFEMRGKVTTHLPIESHLKLSAIMLAEIA